MRRLLSCLPVLLLLAASPASGQHVHGAYCGTPARVHQADVLAFQSARRAGRVARKTAMSPPELGEQRMFNVQEGDNWLPLSFTLKEKNDLYHLWVEDAELANGHVTDDELAGLRAAMFVGTPAASYDPNQGILANNNAIFGQPPDYDGDGIVDILVYDIGRGTPSGTLGYFTSADINPDAAEGVGNQADVLYLDAFEGTSDITTLAVIAAHEYTHLIHANYGFDTFSFISEGLAEYAMVMNGYFWRGINYLSLVPEYTRDLFTWRDGGGPGARDYQRGGLFFTYIASRIGPVATGAMLRTDLDFDGHGPDLFSETGSVLKGAAGLDAVLQTQGLTLAGIISDFHTANFLNDRAIDVRFGYPMPERQGLLAPPTRIIDGTAFRNLEGDTTTVNSGAVQYIEWDNVADFHVGVDAATDLEIFKPDIRARLPSRVVLVHKDGLIEVEQIEAGERSFFFPGAFDRVVLQVVHSAPEVTGAMIVYNANWSDEAAPVATEDDRTLPRDVTLDQNYPNPFNPATTIAFTLDRPVPVRLTVYDLLGRRRSTLVDGLRPAGRHEVRLDASGWTSGTYVYVLETPDRRRSRQMLLLK